MRLRILALGLAILIAQGSGHSVFAQDSTGEGTALTSGKVLPHISCSAHPEQSYALYLPSNYSAERQWPLVISSDPGARGTVPLELQREAAEKFGYVLASSNNSRNGPWKPRLEATDAMLQDVQKRVSVDTGRLYFAGFSGGARASSQFAAMCNCAAGVMLSGAGFSRDVTAAASSAFPVYSAAGLVDFNYGEVVELQDGLTKAGYPHWFRSFEGSHEWAPAAVMEEALAWFRIQAMKAQREARDQGFIDAQFTKARDRAVGFEQASDLLSAWREYAQIAATYDGLADVSAIRAKAEELGKSKAVRDAVKREGNQFADQARLTADITAAIVGPGAEVVGVPALGAGMAGGPRTTGEPGVRENSHGVSEEIAHLRQLANEEKRPERARVYKRAVGEVFITAMESGSGFLEAKSYARAVAAFEAATVAAPNSEWAWSQMAVACAHVGKNKQALNALKEVRRVTADVPGFQEWLKTEKAFERVRLTAEFQSLIGPGQK